MIIFINDTLIQRVLQLKEVLIQHLNPYSRVEKVKCEKKHDSRGGTKSSEGEEEVE